MDKVLDRYSDNTILIIRLMNRLIDGWIDGEIADLVTNVSLLRNVINNNVTMIFG